jgi:cysteinyl-tRNA synthetase
MAEQALGLGFQVHGGGSDLVFPHHENEAAQTRCGRATELAQIWMHNGMLEMRGTDGSSEKMAKSVGNVTSLPDAIDQHGRDALLLFFATGHYRQPLVYAPETLADAASRLRRIREVARLLTDGPSPDSLKLHRDAFFSALAEDFNTPKALAALAEWLREARALDGVGRADLVEMLDVFGLANVADVTVDAAIDPKAQALLEAREMARHSKDWAEADRIREELHAQGWEVRDGASGGELVRRS